MPPSQISTPPRKQRVTIWKFKMFVSFADICERLRLPLSRNSLKKNYNRRRYVGNTSTQVVNSLLLCFRCSWFLFFLLFLFLLLFLFGYLFPFFFLCYNLFLPCFLSFFLSFLLIGFEESFNDARIIPARTFIGRTTMNGTMYASCIWKKKRGWNCNSFKEYNRNTNTISIKETVSDGWLLSKL